MYAAEMQAEKKLLGERWLFISFLHGDERGSRDYHVIVRGKRSLARSLIVMITFTFHYVNWQASTNALIVIEEMFQFYAYFSPLKVICNHIDGAICYLVSGFTTPMGNDHHLI